LGGTTEGEEPDVFDLMSATIVPYEKTYRLCFLRHAKSSYSRWAYSSGDEIEKEGEDEEDNFDLPDKYRSIAPRGKIGAQAVAKMLVSEFSEYVPSIIITSDATRCLDTVECFSVAEPDAFGKTTVILAPEFYEVAHGSDVKAKRIRKAIAEKIRREAQMRGAETVCVVGHNAGWENVVKLMTKSSKKVRMKTSNCALLSCKAGEMTWEEALMEGEWELEKILRVPKELNRKAKLDYPEEGRGNWKEEENEAEEDEDDEGGEIFFDEYVTTE
jgi:phosphohistidine phosphatase SixA